MQNNYLFIIFFTIVSQSIQNTNLIINQTENSEDYVLCRSCGSDVTSSRYLISKQSPFSLNAFNDSIFGKEQVLIQVLSNGIALDFPVITATHTNCIGVGEWEETHTWFPGYRWQVCACPDCGEYIGWLFEPTDSAKQPAKPFYGLILYAVVGESFTNSLSKYPVFGETK